MDFNFTTHPKVEIMSVVWIDFTCKPYRSILLLVILETTTCCWLASKSSGRRSRLSSTVFTNTSPKLLDESVPATLSIEQVCKIWRTVCQVTTNRDLAAI